MDYQKFGRTGLEVSKLCLGCMTYGESGKGTHPWTLDEETSRPLIRQALEAGINFLDTANVYSLGSSEEIVGRAIRDFAKRDEIVLATKVCQRMRPGPNGAGLSRKAIFSELNASLKRLGTDYVDLYQIHRFDYGTPIEETLEALNDCVRAGKVRYIGASSMNAWRFVNAVHVARREGWAEFVSMQNHLNLIYREEEREMIPFCREEGIAVIPWSPLARGRLTRDWDEGSARADTDEFGKTLYLPSDRAVADAVAKVAAARGVPRAQVALAWVIQKPGITAPIIGASRAGHIEDAVAALSLALTTEEIATLEAPYEPHKVAGFV